MIKVFNQDLFQYDVQFVEDTAMNRYLILINFMEDPSDIIDIDVYRKTPLSTTILWTKRYDLFVYLQNKWNADKKTCVKVLLDLLQMNPVELCNIFKEPEAYTAYRELFNENKVYHTILNIVEINDLYFDTTTISETLYDWNKIIAIAALPVYGMVSQIQKSPKYILYNGAFIKTSSYTYNDAIYNKLIYVLAEINSLFQMDEFILETPGKGILKTHVITGKALGLVNTIEDDLDLKYHVTEYQIPVEGREELYEKPSTNIFIISDRPSRCINPQRDVKVSL